jgi:hypothetical protein
MVQIPIPPKIAQLPPHNRLAAFQFLKHHVNIFGPLLLPFFHMAAEVLYLLMDNIWICCWDIKFKFSYKELK